jgi:hypothetical protein
MKRLLGCLGILIAVALLLGAGLAGGIVLDRRVLTGLVPAGDIPVDAVSDFQLMAEAWTPFTNPT